MSARSDENRGRKEAESVGELFAVASMVLFAAANISISQKYRGRPSSGGAFLSIVLTFFLSGAVWAVLGYRSGFAPVSRTALAWFALAGVLTALLGRVFLYASLRNLGAVKGAAIKRLNPLFSVLLGVLLLGEVISGPMALGMVLIIASFAVLIRQSLRAARDDASAGPGATAFARIANLGYLHGPISALAYASGYVARKQGLLLAPDPFLGTLIGALTGIVFFVALAAFLDNFRSDLRASLADFNPWLWLAGLFTSLGQLSYFAALKYSTISKIALITSMEVFVTMFLSQVVMRSESKLSADVVLAAVLGLLGTLLVIRY
jgi:drug/metabolite transporter (DMT)-like permease